MPEIKHISASQIDMFSRCPRQWEFRYVEGKKRRPAVAMIIGTGTHKGVERNMQYKRDTGMAVARDAVAEAAMQGVSDAWEAEEPELTEEERAAGAHVVRGAAIDASVGLSWLHYDIIAPEITPTAVEVEFTADVPGLQWPLFGYIDIVAGENIRDTKTSSKTMTQEDVDRSLQFTVYDYAQRAAGVDVFQIYIDNLIKTKTPKAQTLITARDESDHEQLFRRLEVMARCIDSGLFPPCSPGAWQCSERWCGYWGECEYGAKGRSK